MKVGDIVKRTVARNLKAAREDCHLTQAEAARIVGMTPQAISNYERGINSVDNKTLLKLCNAYGISPNRVLMDDIDTLPEKSNTIPSNVSTDYLLGQEKTSAPLSDAEVRMEKIKEIEALLNKMDDETIIDVIKYAEYLASREGKSDEK